MINFDDLLRQSVSTINSGFEEAQRDLFDIVSEINRSLSNLGPFELAIDTLSSNVKSEIYRVSLDPNTSRPDGEILSITAIQIPSNGYPVFAGRYVRPLDEFKESKSFHDQQDLRAYFAELSSDASSPLIQAVGYALRNKKNNTD